jgi:hypothetical protein
MSLIDHAEREFAAIGWSEEEGPDKWIREDVLQLIRVFAEQGHSGFSAPYAVSMFEKLARYEPLAPLTGKDEEWCEVSEGTWQNRRCSHVFKEADGRAYDIDGKIFREPNGSCFTNRDSRVYITFPYTPKREYVDVAAH